VTTPREPEQTATPAETGSSRQHDLFHLILTLHVPAIAMGLGLGMTLVVLPEISKTFDVGLGTATLVFIAQLGGTVAAPMPTGYLVDRFGRRGVLLGGPILVGIAALGVARAALYGSFEEILVWRFLGGWGEQMWMLSRITVIADTGAQRSRGKQITSMFGVQQIGNLTGPLIGGVAASLWGLWVPFVLQAVVAFIAVVPSFYILKETAPPRRPGGVQDSWSTLLKPPLPAVFVTQFLANVARGGVFGGGVVVLYAAYAYDMSPNELGGLRSAMAFVGIPIMFTAGYVMDRFGRKFTIVPGLFLSGLSLLFMGWVEFTDASKSVFVLSFILVHLAVNIVSGNMQTLGTDVAPPNARGRFFGVSRMVAQSGAFSSPGSFAVLAAFPGFMLLGGSAVLASFIVLIFIRETLRKT